MMRVMLPSRVPEALPAIAAAMLLGFLLPSSLAAEDWPQFRGPERDGVSREGGLAPAWPEAGPPVVWRRSLGSGFSGIATSGGRLFTLFAEDEKEYLAAFASTDGTELWRRPVGDLFTEQFGDGPRSTPAVVDGVVYALGARGTLMAVAAEDGRPVWSVDVVERFGGEIPRRGFAGSPLVDGDLVLLEIGGGEGEGVAALDRASGATRWTALDGKAGYVSPIAVTLGGERQYVFVSTIEEEIVSLRPDGTVRWRHPWPAGTIATPLFVPPDGIFVSTSNDIGAVLVRVREEGGAVKVEEAWRSRVMKNHFSSSVLYGEHIYGFDNGTLKCVVAATGEQCWALRGLGKGSLIAADGRLIVLGDRGQLVLAEATPEEFRELSRFQALGGKSWTAPALAGGRLYLRDLEEMVCLRLDGGTDDATR